MRKMKHAASACFSSLLTLRRGYQYLMLGSLRMRFSPLPRFSIFLRLPLRCIKQSPVLILVWVIAGCDQRQETSADPTPPASPPTLIPAPATEPLADETPVTLQLGALPLAIQAPASWKIESLAGQFDFLTGPAPLGTLHISLGFRPIATEDQISFLFAGAQGQQKKDPTQFLRVTLEKYNDLEFFECLKLDSAPAVPALDEMPDQSKPISPATPSPDDAVSYDWTISIFVPDNGRFSQYAMEFDGLSKRQYIADAQFFRTMLHTVRPRELPDPAMQP